MITALPKNPILTKHTWRWLVGANIDELLLDERAERLDRCVGANQEDQHERAAQVGPPLRARLLEILDVIWAEGVRKGGHAGADCWL